MVVNETPVQDRIERRQVRVAKNPPMEIPVERRELEFVAAICRLCHIVRKFLKIGNESPALVAQRANDAITFDLLAHAKHFDGFIDRAGRYLRAPVALTSHQSFFLQLQKGFPNGTLTALEPRRQIKLCQWLAGAQLSQHDIPLQLIERHGRLCRKRTIGGAI